MAYLRVTILLIVVVGIAMAEPPRLRQQRIRSRNNSKFFARQEVTTVSPEFDDNSTDSYKPPETNGGPYPASGQPASRFQALPVRQQTAPQQKYGAPKPEEPKPTYGAPEDTTPAFPENDSGADDSEIIDLEGVPAERFQNDENTQQGVYYVQLSDGSIQRVAYIASPLNNEVIARVQVQPVVENEPVLVSPIITPKGFSYSSQYQTW